MIIHLYLVQFILGMMVSEEVKKAYLEAEPLIDHLTSSNFKSTIASGSWLIFYGASWCGHCQKYLELNRFTPIWLKAQVEKKSKNWERIQMAKVECTENKDGYPTIQHYHNGNKEQEYELREYEPLIEKIKELNDKQEPTTSAFETLIKLGEEETKPDFSVNTDGEVVYLTTEDFATRTKTSPWLVMFHAPWCGHCKQLAPVYTELAPRLKHRVNVAKVDCTVHHQICTDHKIRGYPTLKFIQSDSQVEFSGPRTLQQLEDFALSFVGKPSFEVAKASDINGIIEKTDAMAVFVFDGKDDMINVAVSIARSVKNQIKLYICPEEKAYASLGVDPIPTSPTLMVYTDNGLNKEKFTGTFAETAANKEYIKNWLVKRKDPIVLLLEAHNQATLTDTDHLLITIVDPDSKAGKAAIKNIKKIASEWKKQYPNIDIRFSWLDGMKYSAYVSKVYGIQIYTLPRVIITQPRDELYFTETESGKEFVIEQESVFEAIDQVRQGKAQPKSTKGVIGMTVYRISSTSKFVYKTITRSIFSILVFVGLLAGSIYYCCLRPTFTYTKVSDQNHKLD